MSRQLVKDQAACLNRPGTKVRCVDEGETVIVMLEPYTPPNAAKYTPGELEALAFIVPSTFPDASPDPTGFYVKPAGVLVAGTSKPPQSSGETTMLGSAWRKFSWSPKTFQWDCATDTLETYLATLEKRFLAGD